MAVTAERLPRSLISLQIEVEPDRVEASIEKAARRVAQQIKIKGFRPGKAPRAVVERTVGKSALLQEALDELLPAVYGEAIESEAIEPIDQPELDFDSMEPLLDADSTEPLIVKATVAVRPTIDVLDYASLRVPKPEPQVAASEIEDAIVSVQRRFATLEPVDRPVAWGDTVRADVTVQVEGQDEPHHEEQAEFRVEEGSVVSLPGLLDRLIGLERGGPHEFSIALPDDFEAEDLAGKQASYQVTLHEVKEEILSELDDEFAQSLDEGFETVEALREGVERDVRAQVERTALAGYHDEIVDLLLASAELEYPEVLVEREIDRLIDEQSNHASHTAEGLAQWLAAIGREEQELRDELRDQSDLNVRRALVLSEFADQEDLEVTEDRIDERLDEVITEMIGADTDEDSRSRLLELLNTEPGRAQVKTQLSTQIALDRLVEICSQPAEEQAERARGSRRRRGRRGEEAGDEEAGAATESEQAAGDDADAQPSDDGDGDQ